jgi:tRNA modification GTPase
VPQILWLHNKADLLAQMELADHPAGTAQMPLAPAAVFVSARTGIGLPELHARLRALASGPQGEAGGGTFTARARQVDALGRAAGELDAAEAALAGETLDLAAESLRTAHDALGEITGRIAPDDLLGHIFSTFCIGK